MKRALSYWWLALLISLASGFFALPTKIIDLRITDAFFKLSALRQALDIYDKRTGTYPSTLDALVGNPIAHVPIDPWGGHYIYKPSADGKSYALYSAGANGTDDNGNGDDITNPEKTYACETYGVNCPPTARDLALYFCASLALLSLIVGLGQTVMFVVKRLRRVGNAA